jgi:adenine-specific DNA-methyltransferase
MIFSQIYTRASFIPFLYAKLFPTFKKDERELKLSRKTAYFVENKVFQLWKVQLDDRIVYVLEIEQKSSKDPRITLTKDAFKILDDNGIDTALVVFHSKDNESYRLSLLTTTYEWWDNKSRSSYKRFSYILWPSEKVKTPKKQLTKPIQDYQDLLSRFKVEVVRDDFFDI